MVLQNMTVLSVGVCSKARRSTSRLFSKAVSEFFSWFMGPLQSMSTSSTMGDTLCSPGPRSRADSGNSCSICCTTISGKVAVANMNCVSGGHDVPIGSKSKLWSMKRTSASSRIADCTSLSETSPRFSADISLPGVAISTWTRGRGRGGYTTSYYTTSYNMITFYYE